MVFLLTVCCVFNLLCDAALVVSLVRPRRRNGGPAFGLARGTVELRGSGCPAEAGLAGPGPEQGVGSPVGRRRSGRVPGPGPGQRAGKASAWAVGCTCRLGPQSEALAVPQ